MTEDEARPFFKQIVYGVAHCHCHSVLHRDIKLENILIGENGNAKLCDFGISQLVEDPKKIVFNNAGTPPYMSPEQCSERGYSGFMSDIWSLGILLYTMVCGQMPWTSNNYRVLKFEIKRGHIEVPLYHPKTNFKYSPEIKDLLHAMCKVDPTKRITIPEILQHPWF